MQPISVKLRGFKGFRAGLGLEEVAIDFENLPEGLVAIVGSNGMGKTTLLDNLHPYRIMPYKLRDKAEWSTGSFSFYDQCYGRDALKEYIWEAADGKRYRSVVQIDVERRKQEAYLFILAADGSWVSYSDAVKDGKTGEYDRAIEELLGTPSLFFSANFRSQDARKLSSYPRSEILSIVCELLDIDKIKEQGEKASKVLATLGNMVTDLERQKEPVQVLLANREILVDKKDQVAASVLQRENTITTLKAELALAEKQIRELELSNAAWALTRKRVEELKQRQAVLLSDIQQQETAIAAGAVDHNAEIGRIDALLALSVRTQKQDVEALSVEEKLGRDTASADLAAIAVKKQMVEVLLGRSDEIHQAVKHVSGLEKTLIDDRTQLEALRATQSTLTASIDGLAQAEVNLNNSFDRNLAAFRQDSDSLAAEEKKEKAEAERDLVDIASKKASAESLLVRSAEIKLAVAREGVLAKQLGSDQPRLNEMRTMAADLRVRIAALASADNELQSSRSRLADLLRLTDGMKGLDCHGDGKNIVNKSCKLLANAVEAEKLVPTVELEIISLQGKQAELASLISELAELTEQGLALAETVKGVEAELAVVRTAALLVSDVTNAEQRINEWVAQESVLKGRLDQRLNDIAAKLQVIATRFQERQEGLEEQKAEVVNRLIGEKEQLAQVEENCTFFAAQIVETEEDLGKARLTANLLPELSGATARIAELNEQETTVNERFARKVADITKKVTEASARSQEQQDALVMKKQALIKAWTVAKQQLDKKHISTLKDVEAVAEEVRKLDATLSGDVDKEISSLNDLIAAQHVSVVVNETQLKDLHGELGNIAGQLADMQDKESGLGLIDAKITAINNEMVHWKIVAKACSNDGIIPLEIGDAGPQISADTNELLRSCYGPRFSARLETQAEKADGGLKEVFDITVFDAERDEEKSIRDMCGGEVTYIEDALSRAFGMRNSARSENGFRTLFTDEKDGALDVERKADFLEIKRRAMEMGTHTREFFITHTPELYEKANARIMFEQGKVSVHYA